MGARARTRLLMPPGLVLTLQTPEIVARAG
jgi:hypothetical protein